jgi:hypothetical protein
MNRLKPKCLRSALYARNLFSISIQNRLDCTVHKARRQKIRCICPGRQVNGQQTLEAPLYAPPIVYCGLGLTILLRAITKSVTVFNFLPCSIKGLPSISSVSAFPS